MKKFFLTFTLAMMVAASAHAGGGAAPTSLITQFTWYRQHEGLIIKMEQMVNPDQCPRNDYYLLGKDHPHYQNIVALIFAAKLSDRPLYVWVDGCGQGLPSIQHVYF